MSAVDDPRLERLLGGAELRALRQRLRRHFERQDDGEARQSLQFKQLTVAEREALAQLTGRAPGKARSMRLDLERIDAALRAAGIADSLRAALERLDGPILPKARLRRELQDRWAALIESSGSLRLGAWLEGSPAARALLKRLGRDPERAAPLLAAAGAVLGQLPARGKPRSQLAAETLGDAHALDVGRPVATLVLAAWRHHEQAGLADACSALAPGEPGAGGGEGAEERLREVWARAGVLVNELARPALLLNLPPAPEAPCTWRAGEPGYLSLRQLLRQSLAWPVAGRRIHVCENPNVVAIAADRLGTACAPLICTDGMPGAAQRALLDQLAAAGACLHYHGDYDWPGIAIGNYVMRTWRVAPWRFGSIDYLAAVAAAPRRPRDLPATGIEADWDGALRGAMDKHGLAVAEEAVVDSLLGDLRHDDQQ